MIFASDNWAGAHPAISAALDSAASGFHRAYGSGELDLKVRQTFNEIFEREVAVFFVATGTAANSLALASVTKPGGVSFCHSEAHVAVDECGAYEYLSGGGRLNLVGGGRGKIDPNRLDAAMKRYPPEFLHGGRPAAVTITQATEIGTVYTLDEIDAIAAVARQHGVPLHMDGARFANALVSLDVSPADMTWRRGVDMLSFGGTKNGCWCAEAVVLFDPSKAAEFAFHHKRAAQLFSKSRFIAAQFDAYFRNGLWLDIARRSNVFASTLAAFIDTSGQARLAWKPQANEVFAIMERTKMARLQAAGAVFHDWLPPTDYDAPIGDDEVLCRFVTSFATTVGQIKQLSTLLDDGVA